MKLFEAPKTDIKSTLLLDKYLIPPFSVLDAKQGYWQSRKRRWLSIGIKSEIGRKDNFFNYNDFYANTEKKLPNVSIFDPVLCECVYSWFSNIGDRILDPFAGGSVRGIVAGSLQRYYVGIDLREEQVQANIQQYEDISKNFSNIIKPSWLVGNSKSCGGLTEGVKCDMLFTCPPYYDLEQYSDLKDDLSNLETYEDFLKDYSIIFRNCFNLMKDDTFAVAVVADIRDSKGIYRGFVADTIKIMQEAGWGFYNDAILLQSLNNVPARTSKQFDTSRKMGKCHQNILVFYKGNPKNIRDKFGIVDIDNNKVGG